MNVIERLFQQSEYQFARIRRHPGQRVPQELIWLLLFFWIALLVVFCLEIGLSWLIAVLFPGAGQTEQFLVLLYRTGIMSAAALLFCRLIERRPLRTMGLTRRHMLRDYLAGVLAGGIMFGTVLLLAWKGGGLICAGMPGIAHGGTYFLLIAGWVMQGLSEELAFRGWLMMSAGTHRNPRTAVAVSALSFAAAHLANSGISVPAFINLLLFSVLMSMIVLRTDSIWAAAAVHSTWNWIQGSFFGLPVSGLTGGDTVFAFLPTGRAEWLTGGAFGPESGLAASLVLLAGIILLLLLPQRRETE